MVEVNVPCLATRALIAALRRMRVIPSRRSPDFHRAASVVRHSWPISAGTCAPSASTGLRPRRQWFPAGVGLRMRPFRRYTHGFPWISPFDVIARTPLEPCGPVSWTGLRPHIVGRGMDPGPTFHVYRSPDDFLSGCPYGKRRLEHMDLSRRSAGVTPRPCDGRTSTRYDRFGCRRSGNFASVWNPLVSPRSRPRRPFAATSSRYHHQGSETTSPDPWLP